MYFSSGFLANHAVIGALTALGAEFFSDQLNHASIIDGLKAARAPKVVYPHRNTDELAKALQHSTAKLKAIYTESVFSMDGDQAPLQQLQILAREHDALLVVDDAHAVGCMGEQGRGLSLEHSVSINTCGKALGVGGATVCGPKWIRDLIINKGRAFIYTTGASPWLAKALCYSVSYVPSLTQQRQRLG